jgi:hypothetical protein
MAILGHLLVKELQGDGALKLEVFGFIDDTHATAAELFHDPVMGYRLADHEQFLPQSGNSRSASSGTSRSGLIILRGIRLG